MILATTYFKADCTAPACEEKFSSTDPDVLQEQLDRHFVKVHPERYHTRMDLPMIQAVRVSDEMAARMFPKSYNRAFQESMV